MKVTVSYARIHLCELLRRVEEGGEIIITRAGKPMAKLVRTPRWRGRRPMGMDAGKIWIADDFDAPLPDDILADFYGEQTPKVKKRGKRRST